MSELYPPSDSQPAGGYPAQGGEQPGQFATATAGAETGLPGQPYGPPGPPPKKKSNTLKVVLITLGVLVLLCGGGVAIAAIKFGPTVKKAAEATKIRVVEPTTLGGRAK